MRFLKLQKKKFKIASNLDPNDLVKFLVVWQSIVGPCNQHFNTFIGSMKLWPVRTSKLSNFLAALWFSALASRPWLAAFWSNWLSDSTLPVNGLASKLHSHWYPPLARHLKYFGKMRFSYVTRPNGRHSGIFEKKENTCCQKSRFSRTNDFDYKLDKKFRLMFESRPFQNVAVFEKKIEFFCVCSTRELLLRMLLREWRA